jgi:hypothetical protein
MQFGGQQHMPVGEPAGLPQVGQQLMGAPYVNHHGGMPYGGGQQGGVAGGLSHIAQQQQQQQMLQ